MTDEELNKRITEKTAGKCRFISGEKSRYSKLKCFCNVHNIEFEVSLDTMMHVIPGHSPCPECKKEVISTRKLPRQKIICDYCGKEFERVYPKERFNFCCKECKDKAQKLESGEKFESLRPKHYGNGAAVYREKAFKEYPHKCAVCGWAEDADILEVHHIDSNRKNNTLDNLIILCPTCHRKITAGKYELINRTKIVKL